MYFGDPWDAPAWDDAPKVDTPVGGQCTHCSDLIEAGGSGVMVWTIRVSRYGYEPTHLECHMRAALGALEHVKALDAGEVLDCSGGHDESDWRNEGRKIIEYLLERKRRRDRRRWWIRIWGRIRLG